MSSDLFIFDSDLPFMPSDPLLPFCDLGAVDGPDILPQDSIDQLSASANNGFLLSSPPTSHQLESLSLCQEASSDFPGGFQDHPGCSFRGDLQEGAPKGDGSPVGYETFAGPHSYGGHDSGISKMVKYMQRSCSSGSFEEKPAAALYQPQFYALMESPDFQGHGMMSSPESCFPGSQIRRVCSTGNLQVNGDDEQRASFSCPSVTDSPLMDETNLKAGRYSAEERKERIMKYRAKKTQRNFSKTIKYACRKTLADSRPRIRGRFARNDEIGELPKAAPSSFTDDDPWLGLPDEEELFGAASVGPYPEQAQFHCTYNNYY